MTTITKIFNFLELSKKAQNIYELMLTKGPVTATMLSQELNMPRSTVYFELGSLQSLKLISITGSYKKRKFVIENPNTLLEILDNKSQVIKDLIPLTQKTIEELQDTIKKSRWNVPDIKFFTGKEGVKKVLESTNYAKSKQVFGIIPAYDIYNILGEKYLKKLVKERIKRKVKVKNIWPIGKIPEFMSKHSEQLRDVVFSKEQISLPSTFLTFDNKVIIITSTKELFSIEITSHDLSQAIKILFEMMWEKAKKINLT
ncbi:MAG: helix-turn-helix domain-containing protein [Patescibacteria group bacterium]